MIQQFVDRAEELKFLEEKYSKGSPRLIVIYGRRRVGKTELIKRFLKDKKGVYILCSRESLLENLNEMKRKFYEITGKDYFLKLGTTSFFELFKFLVDEVKDKKIVIAIDEFPYLIELERGIVSTFQKIWDELLKNTKIFLILCGSSIGMMETEVLSYRSPLYGRRNGQWKVEPFRFKDVRNLFKRSSLEDTIKIWSAFGGVPYYLLFVDDALSPEENIKRKIMTKGEALFEEPKLLLKEEFREPKTYMLILKYLSLGYTSQGELASVTGIEKGNLSKYLSVLEEIQLIEHILPLGQRKRGLYVLKDPFFNFWFRFVYPNISELEFSLVNEVFSKNSSEINAYYGLMFERLVLELVRTKVIRLPFAFNWTGKWWHKDKEIDLIVLNNETKDILFGECKWQENVDANAIIEELKAKAKEVRWKNGERKEYYAVFAKSFKRKPKIQNAFLFDLKDLDKFLR